VPEGQDYSDRITNIEELNCFVIAPIYFPVQKVNPELKYMRLLEGRRWESYLGRATDLFRRGKLQVVFLRGENVGTSNEFRGTVSLGSKSNTGWMTWSLATVLFALLFLLFSSPNDISNTFAYNSLNRLWELVYSIWVWLVGTLSFGAFVTILPWMFGYNIIDKLSIAYRKCVHGFYRLISSIGFTIWG
jgi:hypothetical protein